MICSSLNLLFFMFCCSLPSPQNSSFVTSRFSGSGHVGYGQAFGRALLLYVINAFTMGLTNLSAFFDREKRTVVDMMCNTRVVRN